MLAHLSRRYAYKFSMCLFYRTLSYRYLSHQASSKKFWDFCIEGERTCIGSPDGSLLCLAERCDASRCPVRQTLRFAQGDRGGVIALSHWAARHLSAQRDRPFASLRVTVEGPLLCLAEHIRSAQCKLREASLCPARQTLRFAQGDSVSAFLPTTPTSTNNELA